MSWYVRYESGTNEFIADQPNEGVYIFNSVSGTSFFFGDAAAYDSLTRQAWLDVGEPRPTPNPGGVGGPVYEYEASLPLFEEFSGGGPVSYSEVTFSLPNGVQGGGRVASNGDGFIGFGYGTPQGLGISAGTATSPEALGGLAITITVGNAQLSSGGTLGSTSISASSTPSLSVDAMFWIPTTPLINAASSTSSDAMAAVNQILETIMGGVVANGGLGGSGGSLEYGTIGGTQCGPDNQNGEVCVAPHDSEVDGIPFIGFEETDERTLGSTADGVSDHRPHLMIELHETEFVIA
ncbi:MAG: hypothetical protein WA906_00675 [Pacificimonas sp.]